jgi:hypothetical protein
LFLKYFLSPYNEGEWPAARYSSFLALLLDQMTTDDVANRFTAPEALSFCRFIRCSLTSEGLDQELPAEKAKGCQVSVSPSPTRLLSGVVGCEILFAFATQFLSMGVNVQRLQLCYQEV